MASIEKIRFHYIIPQFHFENRTAVKDSLLNLFKAERIHIYQVNYVFCSDEYLLDINRRFLDHDTYTDIITFPYSGDSAPLHSDIYISVERVRENAKTYGTSFRRELGRVIIHGALHLCGYKDKSKKDILLMRRMEDHYLEKMFHVK